MYQLRVSNVPHENRYRCNDAGETGAALNCAMELAL